MSLLELPEFQRSNPRNKRINIETTISLAGSLRWPADSWRPVWLVVVYSTHNQSTWNLRVVLRDVVACSLVISSSCNPEMNRQQSKQQSTLILCPEDWLCLASIFGRLYLRQKSSLEGQRGVVLKPRTSSRRWCYRCIANRDIRCVAEA